MMMKNGNRTKRYILLAFLVTALAGNAGTLRASEKIGEEKFQMVDYAQRDGELEDEAVNALIQEEEFLHLKKEQREARLEALKIQLQKKKRKRFSEQVRFQTFYDDNYFHEKPHIEKGHHTKGTTVFHVVPTTIVDLGGDRTKAVVTYTPAIEVPTRFNESKVHRFYQNATANVDIPIGKKTFVREFYRLFRGKDRATSETTNFSLRTENHASSEIEYFLSRKFSMAFEHNYDQRNPANRASDSQGSTDHWFLPRFSYHITPKTAAFLQTGIGKSFGGNGAFRSTNLRATLGLSGKITQKSAAYLNIGVLRKDLSEEPEHVKDYVGPFMELIYAYRSGVRWFPDLKLRSGSSTEHSFTNDPFFAAKNFGFDAKWMLNRRLYYLLRGAYQLNTYSNEKNTAGTNANELQKRQDLLLAGGTGLEYKLPYDAAIRLNYDLTYRTSTVKNNRYHENIFLVELAFGL